MYSQYNHLHGSAAATSSTSSVSTSVSTANHVWDGKQWIAESTKPTTTSTLTSSTLPPSQLPPNPPGMKDLDPSSTPVSQLVAHYSRVYQYYQNQLAANSSDPSKKQWFEYYSELASVAAHHYNRIMVSGNASGNVAKQSKSNQPQDQASRWGGKSQSTISGTGDFAGANASKPPKPPKSFKRFCHQSLSRCNSKTQKTAMQEMIKLIFERSYKDGTMFTKNWEQEDLLPVPKDTTAHGASGGIYIDTSKPTSLSSHASSSINTHNPAVKQDAMSYRDAVSSSFATINHPSSSSVSLSLPKSQKSSLQSSTSGVTTISKAKIVRKRKNADDPDIFSSDGLKRGKSYESSLPENDSYYGSGSNNSRKDNDDNVNTRGSAAGITKKISDKAYENSMPENDSYYGSRNKGTKSSETSVTKTNSILDGDYISLSTQRPTKKSKKVTAQAKKKKVFKTNDGFDVTKTKLADRANRFKGLRGVEESEYSKGVDRYMGRGVITGKKSNLSEEDYAKMTVKGTCLILEKEYLRLTSPPKAELVRPQRILEQHLLNLKKSWAQMMQNQNRNFADVKKDYNWYCSQLKAIRQDLTVQRIFNSFSVQVYETHARIALEVGDLNEYNQSQTQLKELYSILGKHEDMHERKVGLQNENEFIAYRIIYYVFLTGNAKYDAGGSDLNQIMLNISPKQRKDPSIAHALAVRVAVAESNYHSFFKLQDDCPNMGAYLMDNMVGSIRSLGLQRMMKAYFPSLQIDFCLKELGFYLGEQYLQDGIEWLRKCGCRFDTEKRRIMTKETVLNESFLSGAEEKNSLI